jgi:hypothetical protein
MTAGIPLPTEHDEQAVFVQWLQLRQIPHFAVDNELHRSGSFALHNWRKKQGFLEGAPDLVILALAPKTRRPVVVEMKRSDGGEGMSDHQRYVAAICRRQGWHYILADGADDAIGQMVDLGFGVSRGPQWEISDVDKLTIRQYEIEKLTKKKRPTKNRRTRNGRKA